MDIRFIWYVSANDLLKSNSALRIRTRDAEMLMDLVVVALSFDLDQPGEFEGFMSDVSTEYVLKYIP